MRVSALVFVLIAAAASSDSAAGLAHAISVSTSPIPREPFKSWSLFVVCHPAFFLPGAANQLEQLYQQFLAYGQAIGPDNVAVWFRQEAPDGEKILDTDRNTKFCARLKLPPSQSPYVIFTTTYPGEGLSAEYPNTFPSRSDLGHYSVLSLNGTSPTDTMRILASLADEVVASKLTSASFDSAEYWSIWRQVYLAVRDETAGLFDRVTLKIDAGLIKADIKMSGSVK